MMAKRKESAAKRRKKMLARKPVTEPSFEELYLAHQRPGNFYLELSGKKQISKDDFWVQSAKEFLRLDRHNEGDEELRSAFARYGMDPNNPRSWRLLLEIFCHVDFAVKRKGGRPPTYTVTALLELWNEMKQRGLCKANQEKAAKSLSKDKLSKFHGRGEKNLRIWIGRLQRAAKEGALEN